MKPWYSEGLKFKCTGCGDCCTGSPGYVYLAPSDISHMARHLNMSEEKFKATYTKQVGDSLSLIDRPRTHDCIFLKDKMCEVYEARPVQCRTFPWWDYQIQSAQAWEEAAERCEGINHPDAPIVSQLEIETACLTYLDNLVEQNFSPSS